MVENINLIVNVLFIFVAVFIIIDVLGNIRMRRFKRKLLSQSIAEAKDTVAGLIKDQEDPHKHFEVHAHDVGENLKKGDIAILKDGAFVKADKKDFFDPAMAGGDKMVAFKIERKNGEISIEKVDVKKEAPAAVAKKIIKLAKKKNK
jgi:6-phosphogluconolactonase (cycloisomerase 2 family)